MAPPAGVLRVGRYFIALISIVAVLYGIVFWPGQSRAPKLGLDLQGGTQVIFKAVSPNGKTPSKSSMSEARQIMENRVNGYGVANSQVVVQGNDEIQISIPGKTNSGIGSIGAAAVLNFRPLIMPPVATAAAIAAESSASSTASSSPSAPTTSAGAKASTAPSPTVSGQVDADRPLNAAASTSPAPSTSPSATPSTTPSATPSASPTASGSGSPTSGLSADPLAHLGFAIPTSETAFNKLTSTQQSELQQALTTFDCGSQEADTKTDDYIACDQNSASTATEVFLLAPVIVPGTEIGGASATAPGSNSGQTDWEVVLHLKSTGQANWSKYTAAHNIGGSSSTAADITQCSLTGTPCADFVAFTLDGAVISAPVTESAINGDTSIQGGFTQTTANNLADQLKYGALPLSFSLQSQESVSATLGSGQLKAGLLAGGIGLILVVLYSLIYYRALGLVTIASLLVSGALTYASLVILGRQIGFTLTLAGIAGFIVAVGITADSFVVFFERIKDEVHEGRSLRVAVPRAWVRARRTILSADTVSFLAAATLYYFAAGDVRGFAFTLGLSTILDLVVVFLFTHPLISVLSRSRSFGSARFSGLNAARDGGVAQAAESHRRDPATKPRRGAAAAGSKAAAVADATDGSAITLLDSDADPDADPSVDGVLGDGGFDAAEPDGYDSVDAAEGDAPARETTVGGTAAERAAARRAAMRGKSPDGGNG